MTICEHVHAGYEPSDNFFILEAAFVLYFLFFDVVNVKSVILTVLALTFQEKYKLLGNFIVTEFNYIFCNWVFSVNMFDFIKWKIKSN